MFAIEVVRFDAQDVIATSSNCPKATEPTLHVYVQNGAYTVYVYDGETFKKANISIGGVLPGAAAKSADGWYAFQYKNGIAKILTNSDGSLFGKCDDSLYHPIQ